MELIQESGSHKEATMNAQRIKNFVGPGGFALLGVIALTLGLFAFYASRGEWGTGVGLAVLAVLSWGLLSVLYLDATGPRRVVLFEDIVVLEWTGLRVIPLAEEGPSSQFVSWLRIVWELGGAVPRILWGAVVGLFAVLAEIAWFLVEDLGWGVRIRIRKFWSRVDDVSFAVGEWWRMRKMDVLGWTAITVLAIGLPILILMATALAIYYSAGGR